MRLRWKHILASAVASVIVMLAVTIVPESTAATEFNGSCLRHRRCETHQFGLTRECHLFTDEMESSRLSKPTSAPEACSEDDWFLMSSCSYFVGGTVACMHSPRRGPAAAIDWLQHLAKAQTARRQATGHYLTETEARERWSPGGEYELGECDGEVTGFEPDRYHVVLRGHTADARNQDCWALDSTSGLERIAVPK